MSNLQRTPPTSTPEFVPSTKLKNQLGAVLRLAIDRKREIIVQNRGVNKVAILPFGEYQKFQKLRAEAYEREERQKAFEQWRQLRQQVQASNPGLTEEAAQQFADEFSNEVMNRVIAKRQKSYG